ncbi:MAG: radical SAM protein [Deltaproteobacteria bacterium]|nr:radical SAM protein [Deltaproteobacteria bacterium]
MSRIISFKRGKARLLYKSAYWHLSHYLVGRDFPLAATFQLTNKCNLRCIMCNIPNNPNQGVLPLNVFSLIVRELSSLGCCFVSLSGGEVLTIQNFFEYLNFAKANIPSVNMVTNGILLEAEAAKEIGKTCVDSVSVSLDGMETTHERIRNLKGAFSKTVNAIENLKRFAHEVKVVVNTVITPWNIDELYELTNFVERLGVTHKFQPLNEHPFFDGQTRQYSIEKEKKFVRAEIEELICFLLRKKNVANSPYFLKSIPDYFSNSNTHGLFNERCLLPKFFCEFREDGKMYPCLGGTGWKGGYPVEQGIKNIYYSNEYRDDIKRLEDCRFCQKSYSVCYIEPRVTFPISSFLKYKALGI